MLAVLFLQIIYDLIFKAIISAIWRDLNMEQKNKRNIATLFGSKWFYGIFAFAVILSVAIYLQFNVNKNTISTDSRQEKVEIVKKKNPNILHTYSNIVSNELDLKSNSNVNEIEIPNDDYFKISQNDNEYLTTATTSSKFPYQKYILNVEQALIDANEINLKWTGTSKQMVDLYSWNYTLNKWVKLNTDISRENDNMSLSAKIDAQTMVLDKQANIIVAPVQKIAPLTGKIPDKKDYDFSFLWMSDTQYYSASYPNTYEKITKYIVDNIKDKKIVYGIHTGDIVDNSEDKTQWENAEKAMKILDKAGFPYGVVSGNHDVGHVAKDYSSFYNYYGSSRFSNKSSFGGSPNNNRDHYDLVTHNDQKFIIIYLGWSIEADTISWANSLLEKYRDYKAIIATHGYMSQRGSFVEQGREINEKIVEPNKNVFLVLCGHYGGAVCNVKSSNGRTYYEMLANYQFNPEGGKGYIRHLYFDSKNDLMYVNTYSPLLNDYNFYDVSKEEFILSLKPEAKDITINTDSISIENELLN